MRILAIDPGFNGALLIGADFWRMPTLQVRKRRDLDAAKLKGIIQGARADLVILEAQMVLPKQGIASSGSIMRQWGMIEGILIGLGVAYQEARASVWRKALRLGPGKPASLQALQRADPELARKLAVQERSHEHRIAVADCWCMVRASGLDAGDDWLA